MSFHHTVHEIFLTPLVACSKINYPERLFLQSFPMCRTPTVDLKMQLWSQQLFQNLLGLDVTWLPVEHKIWRFLFENGEKNGKFPDLADLHHCGHPQSSYGWPRPIPTSNYRTELLFFHHGTSRNWMCPGHPETPSLRAMNFMSFASELWWPSLVPLDAM